MNELRLNIDGRECVGQQGQTILQIARENGIEIPTLCYDDRMEIYGSCGLCVVEVEGGRGLSRSCATMAADGMVVDTRSEAVVSSRKAALELLVSDHVGDCLAPCVRACPGSTDCQGYVGLVANGQVEKAVELVMKKLPFPACIGRVCPHPCETECRRQLVEEPVSIANIKRYMGDFDINSEEMYYPEMKHASGKRVGIIGGGPSGLTAAYYLLIQGHEVTVYDQMPEMGGMLRYGIPEYRLPTYVIDKEVGRIETMGAHYINNVRIGEDITLQEIRDEFDAVYVAVGAWKSAGLRVEGEELDGVVGGIDFLRRVQLNEPQEFGEKIAIVGGGNTAMDACRTAVRMGAKEVSVLYRRTVEEMPAEPIEIEEAQEEGVIFRLLVAPTKINADENGHVKSVTLQKMELGEPDDSGRRRPVPIEGAIEDLEVDLIIGAIGQKSDLFGLDELETNPWGNIISDADYFSTNLEGVFAGGDVVDNGADIAIKCIGDGEKAGKIIDCYLQGIEIPYRREFIVERKDFGEKDVRDKERILRSEMPLIDKEIRKHNFDEVALGFDTEAAQKDAMRCLECGCHDVFECKLYRYFNEYEIEQDSILAENILLNHHNRRYHEIDTSNPYFTYDAQKCILCGLCVRVCSDVMDNGALGLTERGIEAQVRPELGSPLAQTQCISCGQCVATCPVGAFQEKLPLDKEVPVELDHTFSICSYCSVGCSIDVQTHGDQMYRAVPIEGAAVDNGYLCVRGRFGFDQVDKDERLLTPMIRKNGTLVPATWDAALKEVARKLQSSQVIYGSDAVALSVSDRLTNETAFLAKRYARELLQTDQVTCFNRTKPGIADVIGYDASTVSFDELEAARFVLLVGSDIYNDHTIAAIKLKKAIDKHCFLHSINDKATHTDAWATGVIHTEDNNFLRQVLKALLEQPVTANGKEDALEKLQDVTISDEARAFVRDYTASKASLIVYDDKRCSVATKQLLADIAVAAGQIGKARRGILALKDKNNSQGIVDLGIDADAARIKARVAAGEIRSLFVLGEDVPNLDTSKLSFLAVADLSLTETAQKADVVLPLALAAEQFGSYTNTERRLQTKDGALEPKSGMEDWEIFEELAAVLGYENSFSYAQEIFQAMVEETVPYRGFDLDTEEGIWPFEVQEVYLSGKVPTENGLANLVVPHDTALKAAYETTDATEFFLRDRNVLLKEANQAAK